MAEEGPDSKLLAAQQALKAWLAALPVHSTMTESLRPQHFITRQNGTMVPLVALDELPATVSLRGVPRTLSPYDVAGMKGLGTVESQHRQYVVDRPRQGFQPEQKVVENGLLASKYATVATNHELESSFGGLELHSRAASSTAHGPQPKAYGIKETRSALPSNLSNDRVRPVSPPLTFDDLARNPAPGVKEYCSYWLRHGECDYAQQGCLYRHEMPLDPPTLEKLGLRDIPRWYREKHGLGSYLALSAQRAGSGSTRPGLMERNWRNHPDEARSEGTKTPATSPKLQHGHAGTPSIHSPVAGWNEFAQNHTAAYNSTTRGPPHSPPLSRQTFPFPNLPSINRRMPTPRPGSRLVPANTETVSARILREANEQLDASEEQERAALRKYAPLVPQKTGTSPESASITPPSNKQDASSVEMAEAVITTTTTTADPPSPAKANPTNTATTPPPLPSHTASVPQAGAPATARATPPAPAQKKTMGGRARARARRGGAAPVAAAAAAAAGDVDREAQRKAVGRARVQAEELVTGKATATAKMKTRPKPNMKAMPEAGH